MSRTLLFVDDNKLFGTMIKTLLTLKAYRVLYASDIKSATQLIESEKTLEVVVLDFSLKEGTTEDFAKTLRAQLPRAIIIMASGEIEKIDSIRTLLNKEIVNAYLRKPFGANDLDVLIARLENADAKNCPGSLPRFEKRT